MVIALRKLTKLSQKEHKSFFKFEIVLKASPHTLYKVRSDEFVLAN